MNQDIIEKYSAALGIVEKYFHLSHTEGENSQFTWLFNYMPSDTEVREIPFSSMIYLIDDNEIIYRFSLGAVSAIDKTDGSSVVLQVENPKPLATEDGALTLSDLFNYILSSDLLSSADKKKLKAALAASTGSKIAKAPKSATYLPESIMLNPKVENVIIRHGDAFDLSGVVDTTGQLQLTNVSVGPSSSPEAPIITSVAILYDGDDQRFKSRIRFNGFDRQVYDAISSLYIDKKKARNAEIIISYREIWNCMNGLTNAAEANTKRLGEKSFALLSDSIEKFSSRFYMDISNELSAGYLNKDNMNSISQIGIYDGHFLDFRRISTFGEDGSFNSKLQVYAMPVLCEYALAKNQVITVSAALLNTNDKSSISEDTIAIRGYLIREINLMKIGRRNSNKIKLETLYASIGTPSPTATLPDNSEITTPAIRKRAAANRKKIEAILESWIEQNWIKGFDWNKEGQNGQIVAFTIKL